MKVLFARIMFVLSAVALAGCAGQTRSLIPEDSDPFLTTGLFKHDGLVGEFMLLEFESKRFEARSFAIQRNQSLNELRRRFGSGKHYDRIESGVDTDHYEYSAQPELHAADGTTLQCRMTWQMNISPKGYCVTTAGVRLYFRFE